MTDMETPNSEASLRAVPDVETPPDENLRPVDAARTLGISEKRVRQFVDDGRLEATGRQPLRVSRRSVIELKESRHAESKLGVQSGGRHAGNSEAMTAPEILARIQEIVQSLETRHQRALEQSDQNAKRVEESTKEAYHAERDRAERYEKELRDLREELAQERISKAEALAQLEAAQQKRGMFRRG